MNQPEFSLEHIGLAARDTTALMAWYVRLLDARVIFRFIREVCT